MWMLWLAEAIAWSFTPGTVLECDQIVGPLADSTEAALSRTVMVTTMSGTGSGVLVSTDGAILTAAHVVGTASEVTVSFADGSARPARVVRVDPDSDAALIKVDTDVSLPCVSMFASVDRKAGTTVFTLGYPLSSAAGLGTTTRGVWSAMVEAGDYSYVQTDAALNPGNSGGPLFLGNGQLAGIVVAKLVGVDVEGVAFALEISSAVRALAITAGTETAVSGPVQIAEAFDPAPLVSVVPSATTKMPKLKEKRDCRDVSEDPFEPKFVATASGGTVPVGDMVLRYYFGGEFVFQADTGVSTLTFPVNGPIQEAVKAIRGPWEGLVFLELLTKDGSRLRLPAIDLTDLDRGLVVWALDDACLGALAASRIESSRVVFEGGEQAITYEVPGTTLEMVQSASACFLGKVRG